MLSITFSENYYIIKYYFLLTVSIPERYSTVCCCKNIILCISRGVPVRRRTKTTPQPHARHLFNLVYFTNNSALLINQLTLIRIVADKLSVPGLQINSLILGLPVGLSSVILLVIITIFFYIQRKAVKVTLELNELAYGDEIFDIYQDNEVGMIEISIPV